MNTAVVSSSAHSATCNDKLTQLGIGYFDGALHADGALPLTLGCAGWHECERYPEPHIEQTYDLFLGRVVRAWADVRCVANAKSLPLDQVPPNSAPPTISVRGILSCPASSCPPRQRWGGSNHPERRRKDAQHGEYHHELDHRACQHA